jgi:uncharacterized membrane-anchored protein YhcB (DUF1043 family)
MRVSVMHSFFSRAFLMGLALGLLTSRLAEYKMKKKKKLQNLGVTPATFTKSAWRVCR